MWPSSGLIYLLVIVNVICSSANVNAERKTKPDSSNSIADDSTSAVIEEDESQKSDVLNNELFLPDDFDNSRSGGNRSAIEEASGDQDVFQLDRLNNNSIADSNATQQRTDWSAGNGCPSITSIFSWQTVSSSCLTWRRLDFMGSSTCD